MFLKSMEITLAAFREILTYSKTCVKSPLSKRLQIGFQDQLLLNAGQKYCRMLQWEHSAILLTCIKLPFVIKIFVLSIFEWPFYTGFTVLDKGHNKDCCVEGLRGFVCATIGNKSWLVMHLLRDAFKASRTWANMVFHALTKTDVSTQEEMYVHENLDSSLCE